MSDVEIILNSKRSGLFIFQHRDGTESHIYVLGDVYFEEVHDVVRSVRLVADFRPNSQVGEWHLVDCLYIDEPSKSQKCECSAKACGYNSHSYWCPEAM